MVSPVSNFQKGTNHGYNSYEKFIASYPHPTPAGVPVITSVPPHSNTCPAGIMVDPLDSTKKIMYRGNFVLGGSSAAYIDLFVGSNENDPYTAGTKYGDVLVPSNPSYDSNGIRFGSCVHIGGSTVWYYYVGIDSSYVWRICRAVSTDGGRTFTKQGSVLAPNNVDEFSLSGPSILIDNGTWYMSYTAWSGPVNTGGLHDPGTSTVGIKYATSSDGITWTKTGTFIVPFAAPYTRTEDGILYKMGSKFVFVHNATIGTYNWGSYVVAADSMSGPWIRVKPFLFEWAKASACPFLYYCSDGFTYAYYQKEEDPVGSGIDNVYVVKLIPPAATVGGEGFVSAIVTQTTANSLDLSFITATTLVLGEWSIATTGAAISLSSITNNGTTAPKFTLSRSIVPGEVISIVRNSVIRPVLNSVHIIYKSDFTGTSIDTALGAVTNPNSTNLTIAQNNALTFTRTTDVAVSGLGNYWQAVPNFKYGVYYAQFSRVTGYGASTWLFRIVLDTTNDYFQIYNNGAGSIVCNAVRSGVLVSGSSLTLRTMITAGQTVYLKIVYGFNNSITCYYWTGVQWTAAGAPVIVDYASSNLKVRLESLSSATDAAGDVISWDNVTVCDLDFPTATPELYFL